MRHWSVIGVVATLLVAMAGCGSSKSSTSSSAGTTSSAASGGYSRSSAPSTSASTTSAPAESAAPPVAVTSKSSKLGTILAAGPKRMTVYLFEGDKGAESACSAECAAVWPPVTVASAAQASGGAMSADLGTITRSDGTKQVTYKGHPLYFYAKDGDKGDAYGQGIKSFGADWYVLAPSGNKVDHS